MGFKLGIASVAQLVEQKTLNLFVEGSNPSGGTHFNPTPWLAFVTAWKFFGLALVYLSVKTLKNECTRFVSQVGAILATVSLSSDFDEEESPC